MTSTELLPIREGNLAGQWIDRLAPVAKLAEMIAGTQFVPGAIRNDPAAIAAAVLFGAEIGLEPMQSLARIAVIDGKPSVAAETQRALILAAGHELWTVEAGSTRVVLAGRRRGSSHVSEVAWTLDDAKRAGLSGKPSWRAYPRQMLTARATAELARLVFADVIGGLAALEELDDPAALENGKPADETPAPARSRRRSRGAEPPPDEPVAETAAAPEKADETPADDLGGTPATSPQPEPETSLADRAAASAETATPMTDPQRRKMQALFRERDVTERDARLAYVSTVAGRKLETSSDLTIDEAASVIDALEQWNPADPNSKPFPEYDPSTAPFPEGY